MRAFTKGTRARKARGLVAERLMTERRMPKARAFAIATRSVQRMSEPVMDRLAKRRDDEGLRPSRRRAMSR